MNEFRVYLDENNYEYSGFIFHHTHDMDILIVEAKYNDTWYDVYYNTITKTSWRYVR